MKRSGVANSFCTLKKKRSGKSSHLSYCESAFGISKRSVAANLPATHHRKEEF